MSSEAYDIAVVGAGIVGLATARAIAESSRSSTILLEAEDRPAAHQTGHNSGVIHSGLYYRPGSLKARNCAAGREAMYRFCERHAVAHENCGKTVVAVAPDEIPGLEELHRRGTANGLHGLRRLSAAELREREPHVRGLQGLWVPQTGIVDFTEVSNVLARLLGERGVEIRTKCRVTKILRRSGGFVLRSDAAEVEARNLINCGGLFSDRIARLSGLNPEVRIIPFRGEYYKLVPRKEHLVKNLIYPVPDPRFPFLGVHFTRMIRGGVEAGPNAVLALKREGYRWSDFSLRDVLDTVGYRGFWRMVATYGATGLGETYRSLSKSAFVRALRKLIPELRPSDVERHGAGVRAQAVRPDGSLLDDFHILEAERMLHVLNAPSPAATASLSIGRSLAERARETFGLAR